MTLVAQESQEHSHLQSGKLETLGAELDKSSQVCLADAAYGVDVRTGAVILGQVAEETAREKGWCPHGFWGIAGYGVHQCWPRVPFFQGPRSLKPSVTQALEETSRLTMAHLVDTYLGSECLVTAICSLGTACLEGQRQLGGAEGQRPWKGRQDLAQSTHSA